MNRADIIIVFARRPVYGRVKTRLAASIGRAAALEVYQKLLQHTLHTVGKVNTDKIIFYSEGAAPVIQSTAGFKTAVQHGADLGERMKNACIDLFSKGCSKAVIVGTDCPAINEVILEDAFDALSNHDVVIGPALDGGYYLLGMKTLHQALFDNITWSTPAVFDETMAICRANNLTCSLLPVLPDVDEEKDLIYLAKMEDKE